jgi:hypothetical protein
LKSFFFILDDSWGGGIELSILTQEYEVEICVINTEAGGRIDYFGEDKHFPHRVFLFYNNLHYDPGKRIDFVNEKKFILFLYSSLFSNI